MKSLILIFLASCAMTARPVDIVKPGPIYCQPLSEVRQTCRAADGSTWDCLDYGGRWSCTQR
jgi:hypothetical protein